MSREPLSTDAPSPDDRGATADHPPPGGGPSALPERPGRSTSGGLWELFGLGLVAFLLYALLATERAWNEPGDLRRFFELMAYQFALYGGALWWCRRVGWNGSPMPCSPSRSPSSRCPSPRRPLRAGSPSPSRSSACPVA
ncbi:MAG: hypothetical protein AAFX50_16680, partial [Acidobacteriota bacterium]